MGAGWSIAGLRDLYGNVAGYFGLALWCFGPNILAFAQFVTPDIPATVAGLAATYVFWRYLHSPTWACASLAGVLLGIAQLTKFTLLVFYPIWPLLWVIELIRQRRLGRLHSSWRMQAGQMLLILSLSLLMINVAYEFDGSFRPLRDFEFVSRILRGYSSETNSHKSVGNRFRQSWLGAFPVPVPTCYVTGIDLQKHQFESTGASRPSYLAGQWRDHGWWYYYLYALGVKVPLGMLILSMAALALTMLRHGCSSRWMDEVVLYLPVAAILILVSSQTGFNRHLRYVLPAFPFVVIATSKLVYFLRRGPWQAGLLVAVLALWAVGSSLRVYPHSLSYFNELAGGPKNGHNHLENSNIDWGQDLLFLKSWLDRHPEARPLGLAYYNAVDPHLVGIEFELPAYGPTGTAERDPAKLLQLGPLPGYYAVSVNYLRGSNFPVHNGQGDYQRPPLHAYEYFRRFKPIARAGYSIYIYHLTLSEVNAVRSESRPAPSFR